MFYAGYVTFAAVGFAMVLPVAAWALFPDNKLGDLLLAATIVVAMAGVVERSLAERGRIRNTAADCPMVVEWLRGEEPLVFNGGGTYLEIWYALPASARPRLIYLADPQGARRDTGFDTVELGYLALALDRTARRSAR